MRTVRGPVRAGASVSLLPTWSKSAGIAVRPLRSDPPGSVTCGPGGRFHSLSLSQAQRPLFCGLLKTVVANDSSGETETKGSESPPHLRWIRVWAQGSVYSSSRPQVPWQVGWSSVTRKAW